MLVVGTVQVVEKMQELKLMCMCVCVVHQALYLWDRLLPFKIKEDGSSEMDWVNGLSNLLGAGERQNGGRGGGEGGQWHALWGALVHNIEASQATAIDMYLISMQ